MKKYIKASTGDVRSLAQSAADAIWDFQNSPEFFDPRFDFLTEDDVDLLDRARILLSSIAEDSNIGRL